MRARRLKRVRVAVVALCAVIIVSLILSFAVTGVPLGAAAGGTEYYLRETSDKTEAFERANIFNEQLCEEGIVLLKNANNALPLASESKVSVFGKNSVNLVCGGTGSGGKYLTDAKTLYDSLSAAGITYNPILESFYESIASGVGRPSSPQMDIEGPFDLPTGETPQSSYSDPVKRSYADYNDAAIVVISRIGGEGFDLPKYFADGDDRHYLELDINEKDLLREVCGAGFDKVVVVINSANTMELGFVNDGTYGNIDACLWMGFPGESGVMALGRVLNGTVNPSGRTVDTWARDFTLDPTWVNFASSSNADGAKYTVGGSNQHYRFVDYEEGIYTGYRYYETRGFEESGWYEDNVVYPFGYGLSYTDFAWELADISQINNINIIQDGLYTIEVKVTNIGNIPGKDTVQMYCAPPYYKNGIEKAHKVLCGYAKTGVISPGSSEVVTLEFSPYDIASYDYLNKNNNGFTGYELDAGSYKLCIQRNAHDAGKVIPFYVGDEIKFEYDLTTGNSVVNRFSDADDQLGSVLSRDSWQTTWPSARTDTERAVTQTFIDEVADVTHNNPNEYNVMPMLGASSNLRLSDLIGTAYDNEKWDVLLSSLTLDEIQDLTGKGAFGTVMLERIIKPSTRDADGPAGFVSSMNSISNACFYACQTVAASTWNTELLYAYGESLGEEALWGNDDGFPYSGIYAPGVNIHRSPFGGRNFEYYSEDSYLSGKMAAAVIRGAQNKGLTMYVKHFALNEQETNRSTNGLVTWATEQSIREIYLKPFEKAVKEGGARGIMTSFNRIGTKWTGGDYRLLAEVLRNEWGFRGTVISEFNTQTYMDIKQMVYAGGDLNFAINRGWNCDKTDPGDVTVLRLAAKNILYTVANSNAMNFTDGVYDPIVPKPPTDEFWKRLADLYDEIKYLITVVQDGNAESITEAVDLLVGVIAEIEKEYYGTGYIEHLYNDVIKANAPLYLMIVENAAAEIALCYENADGDLRKFTEDLHGIVKKYLVFFELLMQIEGYDISAVKNAVNTVFDGVLAAIDKIYDIIGKPEPIEPDVPGNPVDDPVPGNPNPVAQTPTDETTGCSSAVSTGGIAAAIGLIITAAFLLVVTAKKKMQN